MESTNLASVLSGLPSSANVLDVVEPVPVVGRRQRSAEKLLASLGRKYLDVDFFQDGLELAVVPERVLAPASSPATAKTAYYSYIKRISLGVSNHGLEFISIYSWIHYVLVI
jgi:hypothetical protein